MASRLTTNQEIAGSTPAVVIVFFTLPLLYLSAVGSIWISGYASLKLSCVAL
jgi:hypothetical protein